MGIGAGAQQLMAGLGAGIGAGAQQLIMGIGAGLGAGIGAQQLIMGIGAGAQQLMAGMGRYAEVQHEEEPLFPIARSREKKAQKEPLEKLKRQKYIHTQQSMERSNALHKSMLRCLIAIVTMSVQKRESHLVCLDIPLGEGFRQKWKRKA
jgi:hypothetical protein